MRRHNLDPKVDIQYETRKYSGPNFIKSPHPPIEIIMTRSAISGSRDRFFVGKEYEAYFPKVEHSNYNTFLDLDGQSLKSELRTRIVLLRRETNGAAKQES